MKPWDGQIWSQAQRLDPCTAVPTHDGLIPNPRNLQPHDPVSLDEDHDQCLQISAARHENVRTDRVHHGAVSTSQ